MVAPAFEVVGHGDVPGIVYGSRNAGLEAGSARNLGGAFGWDSYGSLEAFLGGDPPPQVQAGARLVAHPVDEIQLSAGAVSDERGVADGANALRGEFGRLAPFVRLGIVETPMTRRSSSDNG